MIATARACQPSTGDHRGLQHRIGGGMCANHSLFAIFQVDVLLEILINPSVGLQEDGTAGNMLGSFCTQREVFENLDLTRLLGFDTSFVGPFGRGSPNMKSTSQLSSSIHNGLPKRQAR